MLTRRAFIRSALPLLARPVYCKLEPVMESAQLTAPILPGKPCYKQPESPTSLSRRNPSMALKPTIYKFNVALSDIDRDVYESLNLTLARHPSETMERMLVRLLAFCFNTRERLEFCKGISDPEEPDLWQRGLDGNLELWIDVGEPAVERIKKATRVASLVKVYSFNSKADTWWGLNRDALVALPAEIFQFQWDEIKNLADRIDRTMDLSVTISEASAYVATARGECEVALLRHH
jgi:uncharacterized protein YaeQ